MHTMTHNFITKIGIKTIKNLHDIKISIQMSNKKGFTGVLDLREYKY